MPSVTYLLGLAAAVYVTTCLVCAAVRWFHMCRPYNREPRYYYPGRPYVTGAWLSSLCLLPYVLNPENADAWFLARLYFLPVTLYHFVIILSSYFGSVMHRKKWLLPTVIAGVPVAVALIAAVVLAVLPGIQIEDPAVMKFVLYILGILITTVCLASITVVLVWAGRFDPDDFSNPDDFPVKQARKWTAIIILNVVMCWAGTLIGSREALAVLQLMIAFCAVLFVISALHPNRNRPVEEPSAEAVSDAAQLYHRSLPRKKQVEILEAIRIVVEQKQAFLEPHLTLQDVADRCGYNRTYISGLIKNDMGGFFSYVNGLRLTYVDEYLRQHPDSTLSEAIDAAGFGSRPTYYSVKSKLRAGQ